MIFVLNDDDDGMTRLLYVYDMMRIVYVYYDLMKLLYRAFTNTSQIRRGCKSLRAVILAVALENTYQ